MRTRLSDESWIISLAMRSGVEAEQVRAVWDAMKDEICFRLKPCEECPGVDRSLFIPGFGTFSRTIHKGHPLNLGAGKFTRVTDYPVLKFKAHDMFKKKVLCMEKPECV